MFYEQEVDLRSRKAMEAFLSGHYSYHDRNKAYANRVKLQYLGLTNEQYGKAFDVIMTEEYWEQICLPMDTFTRNHFGEYAICTAGRSSGYLVLHESRYQDSGYLSYCQTCGQQSYKRVADDLPKGPEGVIASQIMVSGSSSWQFYASQPEIMALGISQDRLKEMIGRLFPKYRDCTQTNRCGRCHASGEHGRVNYEHSPKTLRVNMLGLQHVSDFEDWSMEDLRTRVRLIQSFDQACDQVRDLFLSIIDTCEVIDDVEVINRPIKRLVCNA